MALYQAVMTGDNVDGHLAHRRTVPRRAGQARRDHFKSIC
jgi:hypothetical protein